MAKLLLLPHLARHREAVGDGRRGQPGPALEAGEDVGEELAAALLGRVLRPVGEDLGRQHALGVEPRVDLLQPVEAGQQQPGGDEEHERGRDLRRRQQPARAVPRGGVGGVRAGVLEGRRHVAPSPQGGGGAERDPGRQRQPEGEREHPAVDRHLRRAGREQGRERHQQVEAQPRDEQAEGAGREGEEARLGDELPQQAAAARAEGRPEGELALAPAHPRHGEVGDVGARDEQHEGGGGEQDQQRGAGLARQLFGEGQRGRRIARVVRIGLGMGALQPARHRGQLRPEAVDADAGREPAEGGHAAERGAVLLHPGLGAGAEGAGRRGHVDVVLARVLGDRRQHPDHRVGPVVHLEDLPDDVRVGAEALLPVGVAEDEDRLGPEVVVGVAERPAVQRLHAEHVEEVRRHHPGQHAVRLAPVQQRERHAVVLDEAVHGRELLPVVAYLLDREGDVGRAGPLRLLPGEHQLVPVGVGQRPQQDPVDEAEDGGVGADAEPEGQHHGQGVPRRPEQRAQTVACVPYQRVEHGLGLNCPGAPRGGRRVAGH